MRRHRWVLLAFVGLSLLLTWPLVAHFGSHVPGDGIDDPSLAWNLWWARHTLVDQPQNPFTASWIFWPVGINLAFYTLTLLNGLLSVPLQLVSGVVPAYNVLLLSSFVLGGYGAYLLCLEAEHWAASRRVAAATPLPFRGGDPSTVTRRGATTEGWPRLGRGWVDSRVGSYGAFLGGTLYAFASAKLFYAALGQGNVASSQWVPFAALYLVRAARPAGRWRDAALAALFLVLQAYAEQTYASFLVIFAGVVFVWGIIVSARNSLADAGTGAGVTRSSSKGSSWVAGLVARFALIGLLFAAGLLPYLANMLPDLRAEGDFFSAGGGFADVFSADLAGYTFPTQLHPVFGGLARAVAAQAHFPIDKGQQIFVGYSALALALVGLIRWRRRARGSGPSPWFWAFCALLFFLLTLGPTLRVAGHDTGLPLPFALVAQLPFFKGNRYPSRYSVMLLLSLAPLVAWGAGAVIRLGPSVFRTVRSAGSDRWSAADHASRITQQGSRNTHNALRFMTFALLAVLLFEHLSIPVPTFDLSVPALYQWVAEQPGDFAVLELPPGWRNGARVLGKQDIVIMQEMWYQTVHGKRLLGGNTSRNPEFKFQYFAEDPTLARLIAQTNAADLPQHTALREGLAGQPVTEADRARARAWAGFLNLRYVVVHRDKLPAETEALLGALLPVSLVREDGRLALYALPSGLAPPKIYAVGTDQGRMALGEGWNPPAMGDVNSAEQPPALAERKEVRLLLPLGAGETRVEITGWAAGPGQRAALVVDGRQVSEQALSETPAALAFDVPADAGRPPVSDVRLRFAKVWPVEEVEMRWAQAKGAANGSAGGFAARGALLVRSAGTETGDFAHIFVNGRDLSPNGRGYNLVALSHSEGSPSGDFDASAAAASFDTHLDPGASARLAAWVAALPPGTLVLGAVRDEGSMSLGDEAVQALASLGVSGNLRGRFRWGHAFIGVTGAKPSTALEALDGVRPAQVAAGLAVDAPWVAAAVTQVTVGK